MQKIITLNDLYQSYSLGDLQKKDFEGRIFTYILKNYQYFQIFNWDKDQCIDYLCWLYPRLTRAIDKYKDIGSSFDSYICSVVRWSAREYRRQEADHHVTEYACWEARAEDMMVCTAEPDYLEQPLTCKPVSNPKQILIILLKSYFFLSDDLISRIAPAIKMKQSQLCQMVDALRRLRIERDEKIRNFQERIHCQYYRCIAFEKRLDAAPAGSAYYEKMKYRLARAKKRYQSMRKRYAAIKVDATNRQVAEILGVPKGTIDSNLYALKQKSKALEPEECTKAQLNYIMEQCSVTDMPFMQEMPPMY